MEFLSVREFTASPKNTKRKLGENGKIILTNHGKPMALVVDIGRYGFEEAIEYAKSVPEPKNAASAVSRDNAQVWLRFVDEIKDIDEQIDPSFDYVLQQRMNFKRSGQTASNMI